MERVWKLPLAISRIVSRNQILCEAACRVQKEQSPHYWHMGGKNLKSVNQYKYLGAVLDTELPDDKDIQRQLR